MQGANPCPQFFKKEEHYKDELVRKGVYEMRHAISEKEYEITYVLSAGDLKKDMWRLR